MSAAASGAKAGSAMIWALIESGGMAVMSLLTLVILARLVGPTELGIAALAFGMVQILTIIAEMLPHDAVVQRIELDDSYLDTAFWTSATLGVVLCAACVIAAPAFARAFAEPDIADVIYVAASSLVMSGLGAIPQAVLRRQADFKSLALRSLYGRVAAAAAGLILAVCGAGVWAVVALQLVQTAVSTALVWPAVTWRPRFHFSPRRLRELLAFGVPSVSGRLMWVFALRLFTILYGYFFGVTAAGYLNIAQRVVDKLFDTLAGAAYNLALPFLAHRQNDKPSFMRAFRTALEFTALVMMPLFTGLAILAPAIVSVFLGHEWVEAAPLIRVFAIGAMAQFLFLLPNVALVAAGRPGAILTLSLVSLVFAFGALLILQPDDPFVAAIIWSCRVLATAPLVIWFMRRLFANPVRELLSGALAPLGATAAMTAGLMALQECVLGECSDVMLLAAFVPAGAVIYFAGMFVLGRDISMRIVDFVLAGLRGLRAR